MHLKILLGRNFLILNVKQQNFTCEKKIFYDYKNSFFMSIRIFPIQRFTVRWQPMQRGTMIYQLVINVKSLNQVLKVFLEIELLPTTSIDLKIG